MSRDEAVIAATAALGDHARAVVAVDAVWSVIERAVRAQAAAEIRAVAQRLDALTITHQDRTAITVLQIKREATEAAARIVEETP